MKVERGSLGLEMNKSGGGQGDGAKTSGCVERVKKN